MPRLTVLVAVVALVAALSSRAPADGLTASHLDPARMFDPGAESLLARLFTAPKEFTPDASPVSVALFYEPSPAAATMAMVQAPVQTGTATISAVNLHVYKTPLQLEAPPLAQAPVTAVAPAAHVAPHLTVEQPRVQIAAVAPPEVRFGAYAPYVPAMQHIQENVQVPVRIGPVHFSGSVSGDEAQTVHADAVRAMQICGTTDEAAACPYLHDERAQNIAAGTNFNLRAGNTQVRLELSGSVGQVSNGDAALYQYSPLDADTQLDAARAGSPEDTSLLYYPGLTEVVRHGMNARVAVPLSHALTVGLQYDTAHYQGNYNTVLLAPGLDARKDTYLGNVTYQIPNSSSLITLSARQFRYQDTFAPNFNLTETRADLSLTVKF